MNVLTDPQRRSYDYLSRYKKFPFSYNTVDNKYIYHLTQQLSNNTECIIHSVTPSDNLDFLANKYYGRPDLFWVIADFNRISDPFISLFPKYKTLKIPALTTITYNEK